MSNPLSNQKSPAKYSYLRDIYSNQKLPAESSYMGDIRPKENLVADPYSSFRNLWIVGDWVGCDMHKTITRGSGTTLLASATAGIGSVIFRSKAGTISSLFVAFVSGVIFSISISLHEHSHDYCLPLKTTDLNHQQTAQIADQILGKKPDL